LALDRTRRFLTRRAVRTFLLLIVGGPALMLGIAVLEDAAACPVQDFVGRPNQRVACQEPWVIANQILVLVVFQLVLLNGSAVLAHVRVSRLRRRLEPPQDEPTAPLDVSGLPAVAKEPPPEPRWAGVRENAELLRFACWGFNAMAILLTPLGLFLAFFVHTDDTSAKQAGWTFLFLALLSAGAATQTRRAAKAIRREADHLLGEAQPAGA
jgi:hypothetical protein